MELIMTKEEAETYIRTHLGWWAAGALRIFRENLEDLENCNHPSIDYYEQACKAIEELRRDFQNEYDIQR